MFCTGKQSVDDMYQSARKYFYFVDKDGKLYLEETEPKTFITAFKAPKFLDFFWRNIRNNTSNVHPEYPWISHCGRELNFIKCEASIPIVFHDLIRKVDDDNDQYRSYEVSLDEAEQNNFEFFLQFGGTLRVPLDPSQLKCDLETGRLYHAIPQGVKSVKCSNVAENNNRALQGMRYAVIGSHLLLRMINEFEIVRMSSTEDSLYRFKWNWKLYDIPSI